LVASSYFFNSNYPLLAPKTPLFSGCFVLPGYGLGVLKGFIYTILVWMFMLFTLHLVPFCPAFSTILHCVLHQNALHFAPKRTAFSGILHCVLRQIAPKTVLMACF